MKRYDLNDKVLCKHGSYYYEAKITEITEEDGETVYVVHYQGWHKRYDERIIQSETIDKFLPFTEENIARCKKEIQDASSSKNKRRKTKESNEEDVAKIAKKRADAGSDVPAAATSTTLANEAENTSPTRERDPALLQELDKLIDMPTCLLQILVDDSDIMTRQRMVSRLPARHTVDSIINDYCTELGYSPKDGEDSAVANSSGGLGSSALGLRDFFNKVLGYLDCSYQLLYKFERPQYAAEIEKAVGSSDVVLRKRRSQLSSDDIGGVLIPSKLYGLPHLLRLIVRLASLLRDVTWNDTVFRDIITCTQHLIGFLERNYSKYYSIENDYENTTPEYQKTAWSSSS
ncbi:hypothetical protein DICVIV_04237 [Dictyocaulus viviparus]|uniref:Uncharacterized protein n=1 Tax=Dictyocaulus viviparus TaxID=29172 RepID=A0A0D8Y0F8_DICVI|nr:hypothetical protein DICVIV_04237 [Dictyocaulus viviparus]